jgi:hypothetical protein
MTRHRVKMRHEEHMTDYTIRVVLKDNATWNDYVKLHDALARAGISDEIAADDGTIYKMPPAEYNYSGTASLQQVHAAAKTAANTIKPNNSVLVTQPAGRLWSGLDVVRQARRAY